MWANTGQCDGRLREPGGAQGAPRGELGSEGPDPSPLASWHTPSSVQPLLSLRLSPSPPGTQPYPTVPSWAWSLVHVRVQTVFSELREPHTWDAKCRVLVSSAWCFFVVLYIKPGIICSVSDQNMFSRAGPGCLGACGVNPQGGEQG